MTLTRSNDLSSFPERSVRHSDAQRDAERLAAEAAIRLRDETVSHIRKSTTPLTYQETKDGRGHDIRIGKKGSIPVYCHDQTGEWDSKDGHTWVRRGTDGVRVWRGTLAIDGRRYVSTNSDTGVTQIVNPDRSTIRRMTDSSGTAIEVKKTAGSDWQNTKTKKSGRIDEFGQYLETVDGAEVVKARSRELSEVLAREKHLTEKYGVTFRQPGEKVTYDKHTYSTRPPTKEELDCAESVLERNRQMDLRGLCLSFIKSNSESEKASLYGNYRAKGHDGKPEILIFPHVKTGGWSGGIEGTLSHELVHHEQNLNWGRDWWGLGAKKAETERIMRDFGWTYDAASDKYRLLDRDHKPWQYNGKKSRWEPVIDGSVVPERSISSTEMRNRALVRPATTYNSYPWETDAEAKSMLRGWPEQLWKENQNLYRKMQASDQKEIDKKFGTDPDGKSHMIRGRDSRIVPNTERNRNDRTLMELDWSNKPTLPRDVAQRAGCCGTCMGFA